MLGSLPAKGKYIKKKVVWSFKEMLLAGALASDCLVLWLKALWQPRTVTTFATD